MVGKHSLKMREPTSCTQPLTPLGFRSIQTKKRTAGMQRSDDPFLKTTACMPLKQPSPLADHSLPGAENSRSEKAPRGEGQRADWGIGAGGSARQSLPPLPLEMYHKTNSTTLAAHTTTPTPLRLPYMNPLAPWPWAACQPLGCS